MSSGGIEQQAARTAFELQRAGRTDEMLDHLRSAVKLVPSAAGLWSDIGVALKTLGRHKEAVESYSRSLQLEPTSTNAYNNLAVALQAHGDPEGAARAYRAALHLAPSELPTAVPLNLMRCELEGGRWASWPLLRWLASRSDDPDGEVSAANWAWSRLEARAFLVDRPELLHAAAAREAEAVRAAARASWACDGWQQACVRSGRTGRAGRGGGSERLGARARADASGAPSRRKLRVALLSDLDADPCASLLRVALPLLQAGGDVELSLLSTTPGEPSEHLEAIADGLPDVYPLPAPPPGTDERAPPPELCEAQSALAEVQPHVTLEVMGYLPAQQLALLARPCTRAPVQVSWLRQFHGSMRADFIDYSIVDRRALPPSLVGEYTERLVFLPHFHLVNGHAAGPHAARAAAGAAPRGWPHAAVPLACSLNRVNKLEPIVFSVWTGALARARAPLWVATGAGSQMPARGRRAMSAALAAEAMARGMPRRRLLSAPRAKSAGLHMNRVARCALSLDSRLWGAHTTALDALWSGVGVLSAPGSALATRASHSTTEALGAPALSVAGLRAYADLLASLLAPPPSAPGVPGRPAPGRSDSAPAKAPSRLLPPASQEGGSAAAARGNGRWRGGVRRARRHLALEEGALT